MGYVATRVVHLEGGAVAGPGDKVSKKLADASPELVESGALRAVEAPQGSAKSSKQAKPAEAESDA